MRPRILLERIRTEFRAVFSRDANPHPVALGCAIGVFVGTIPGVGFHVLLSVGLARVLRANPFTASLGCFVSNPITIVPLAWLGYLVGLVLLPGYVHLSRAEIQADFTDLTFDRLVHFGSNLLTPLLLGNAVLGVLLGVSAYLAARAFFKGRKSIDVRRARSS